MDMMCFFPPAYPNEMSFVWVCFMGPISNITIDNDPWFIIDGFFHENPHSLRGCPSDQPCLMTPEEASSPHDVPSFGGESLPWQVPHGVAPGGMMLARLPEPWKSRLKNAKEWYSILIANYVGRWRLFKRYVWICVEGLVKINWGENLHKYINLWHKPGIRLHAI